MILNNLGSQSDPKDLNFNEESFDPVSPVQEPDQIIQDLKLDLKSGLEKYHNLKCTICLELSTDPRRLPCNHLFCSVCILNWFERHKNCPLCKAEEIDDPISLNVDETSKKAIQDLQEVFGSRINTKTFEVAEEEKLEENNEAEKIFEQKLKRKKNFDKYKDLKCLICLELCFNPRRFPCSHLYCTRCILEWYFDHRYCPTCKDLRVSDPLMLKLDKDAQKEIAMLKEEYGERINSNTFDDILRDEIQRNRNEGFRHDHHVDNVEFPGSEMLNTERRELSGANYNYAPLPPLQMNNYFQGSQAFNQVMPYPNQFFHLNIQQNYENLPPLNQQEEVELFEVRNKLRLISVFIMLLHFLFLNVISIKDYFAGIMTNSEIFCENYRNWAFVWLTHTGIWLIFFIVCLIFMYCKVLTRYSKKLFIASAVLMGLSLILLIYTAKELGDSNYYCKYSNRYVLQIIIVWTMIIITFIFCSMVLYFKRSPLANDNDFKFRCVVFIIWNLAVYQYFNGIAINIVSKDSVKNLVWIFLVVWILFGLIHLVTHMGLLVSNIRNQKLLDYLFRGTLIFTLALLISSLVVLIINDFFFQTSKNSWYFFLTLFISWCFFGVFSLVHLIWRILHR